MSYSSVSSGLVLVNNAASGPVSQVITPLKIRELLMTPDDQYEIARRVHETCEASTWRHGNCPCCRNEKESRIAVEVSESENKPTSLIDILKLPIEEVEKMSKPDEVSEKQELVQEKTRDKYLSMWRKKKGKKTQKSEVA
uniref:Uncharacterized protein n=1 Tax=Euplotes harpa TaxID=151035 RepID=A0A7S3NCD6_9SPIT|mmetsp:Transcript_35672/g.41310  ORF Transcript_35672/g.41310 Transcript_35672/m.41310 type:complete len:140 (+) Transcript_35672:133-552(+)